MVEDQRIKGYSKGNLWKAPDPAKIHSVMKF